MYRLIKDNKVISCEDKLRYVKHQTNGVDVLCSSDEADGIVINNDYIVTLDGIVFDEFDGAGTIDRMNTAGAEAMRALNAEPPISAGVFTYGEWRENTAYKQYDLFTYNGHAGFVRQAHTSLAVYPPFSVGTESLYGARPAADANDVYPYIYNMKVETGMKVRSEKDSEIYTAINDADPLLYDPADLPAIFTKE